MNRFTAFAMFVAISLVLSGAQAQKPADKMGAGKMAGGKMSTGKGGVTGTSKGTVKGAPSAKSFTLSTAKGDYTVDTSSAKLRNSVGHFVKADKLTAGASVEVTGTWRGKTLAASSVKITSLKEAPVKGGKVPGALPPKVQKM